MSTPKKEESHRSILDHETDARFWAQYQYKPHHKLDPGDPVDQTMIPAWKHIWEQVKQEDRAGRLVLTYNHPDVEQGLADAAAATHAVAGHLEAAAAAPDPETAGRHVAAAADAAATAASASAGAAARQPPVASVIVADAAAADASRVAAVPPPHPVASALPPDHPAIEAALDLERRLASSAPTTEAQAIESATRSMAAAYQAQVQAQARAPATPGPTSTSTPAASTTVRDQLAAAQAIRAPSIAAQVHEDAAARSARGEPPPEGALHPRAIGSYRELATRLAQDSLAGEHVGVDCSASGQWSVPLFRSRADAAAWYAQASSHLDDHRYLAWFDKTGMPWPAPVAEVFGSSRAIGSPSSPAAPTAPAASDDSPGYGRIAAIGAGVIGVALLAGILAGRGGSGGGDGWSRGGGYR